MLFFSVNKGVGGFDSDRYYITMILRITRLISLTQGLCAMVCLDFFFLLALKYNREAYESGR